MDLQRDHPVRDIPSEPVRTLVGLLAAIAALLAAVAAALGSAVSTLGPAITALGIIPAAALRWASVAAALTRGPAVTSAGRPAVSSAALLPTLACRQTVGSSGQHVTRALQQF